MASLAPKVDAPKFDDCMKLADYWADSYERRRAVEWKVSLGFWAVLLTGIISRDKLQGIPGWWFLVCSAIMFFGYVVLWLLPMQIKNERDKVLSYYFANQAMESAHLPALSSFSREKESADRLKLISEVQVANPMSRIYPLKSLISSLLSSRPWFSLSRYYSVLFHALTTLLLLLALNYMVANGPHCL